MIRSLLLAAVLTLTAAAGLPAQQHRPSGVCSVKGGLDTLILNLKPGRHLVFQQQPVSMDQIGPAVARAERGGTLKPVYIVAESDVMFGDLTELIGRLQDAVPNLQIATMQPPDGKGSSPNAFRCTPLGATTATTTFLQKIPLPAR